MQGFEIEAHQLGYPIMMYSSDLSGERGITILKSLAGRRIDSISLIDSYVTYSSEAQTITQQTFKQRLSIGLGNLEPKTDVLHSDIRLKGIFTCLNPSIDKLYQNTLCSQKGNCLKISTKMPPKDW